MPVDVTVQEIANLQGLVVIDVVEGTALSSLPHMVNVLRQRPSSFPSLQHAVHWARKSGEPARRTSPMTVCLSSNLQYYTGD